MDETKRCAFCLVGYHAPFSRFEKIAALPDGPLLLMRCKDCGCLWQEGLHDVRRISAEEAATKFRASATK